MGTQNSPGQPFPEAPECTAIQACPPPKGYDKTTWNGYMTVSADALDPNPLFYSGTVNDPKDPLVRKNCGPGRCQAVYDFVDITIARDGTVWGAFVDACIYICTSKDSTTNDGSDGIVGHLVGGPKLN
jgi:hypothetical protein